MPNTAIETFTPASRQEWRQWLQENHQSKPSVWLVCYKKLAGTPTISHTEAVDEALCFGWIDGTRKSLDSERFLQFFCKRKPRSVWSKINKAKISQLIAAKQLAPAGYKSVEVAKQNGSWSILDEVEAFTIPKDLASAFRRAPGSKQYFLSLSKSMQKSMLQWIVLAKQAETREKRINEIATQAAQQTKPKQFR